MEWDLEKRIKQLKEVGYKVNIVDNNLFVESETIKKKINISDGEIFFQKGRHRVLSNIDLLIARKEQENWLKIFRENKPKKELMNNTKKAYSSPTITIKKEFDFDLHSDILQKFKELKQIGYEVNFIKDDYELILRDGTFEVRITIFKYHSTDEKNRNKLLRKLNKLIRIKKENDKYKTKKIKIKPTPTASTPKKVYSSPTITASKEKNELKNNKKILVMKKRKKTPKTMAGMKKATLISVGKSILKRAKKIHTTKRKRK